MNALYPGYFTTKDTKGPRQRPQGPGAPAGAPTQQTFQGGDQVAIARRQAGRQVLCIPQASTRASLAMNAEYRA